MITDEQVRNHIQALPFRRGQTISIPAVREALEAYERSKLVTDKSLPPKADELLAESAYSSIYDTAPEVEQEPFIWLVLNGVVVIRSYYDKTKAEVFANEMQKTHDLSGSLASFSVMPVYTNPQPNQFEQHLELVKPEPVAYRWWNQGCNCDECDQYFYSEDPDFISKNREPLYTTPPTREPLSEDFLLRLAEECTTQFFNGVHQNATIHFARAVEQAHGIGVTND